MATGKQMLTAVLDAIKNRPGASELRISTFDAYDLFKLQPTELQEFGVDEERSEAISNDLLQNQSLSELGAWLGKTLIKVKDADNLIPGEGIRRSAGIWANGNNCDPDAIVQEIRQLRNPTAR
jgi:hypothetical protein